MMKVSAKLMVMGVMSLLFSANMFGYGLQPWLSSGSTILTIEKDASLDDADVIINEVSYVYASAIAKKLNKNEQLGGEAVVIFRYYKKSGPPTKIAFPTSMTITVDGNKKTVAITGANKDSTTITLSKDDQGNITATPS